MSSTLLIVLARWPCAGSADAGVLAAQIAKRVAPAVTIRSDFIVAILTGFDLDLGTLNMFLSRSGSVG